MKKNLTLISLMLGVMLVLMVSGVNAVQNGANVSYETSQCGETTFTAHKTGTHNVQNMYLLVEVDGDLQYVNIPSNGDDVSITVGPFTEEDVVISWRVSGGGGERDYDQPSWNGYGESTFDANITAYGILVGNYDWNTYGGTEDPNPFTTWNDFEVDGCLPQDLTITSPVQGEFFDNESVPINWSVGQGCESIVYSILAYHKSTDGTCKKEGPWTNMTQSSVFSIDTQQDSVYEHSYLWDKPQESGQYCVYVETHSCGVKDWSEVFNVDHAKPIVNLTSVGNPSVGDCEEGEGECYVNNQTQITLSCADNNPDAPWQSGVDYIEYRYQINNSGTWLGWFEIDGDSGSFSFPEDSNHTLEYRCVDNVDKVSESKFKTFIVDSVAPELSRTVGDPKICEGEEPCTIYVNTSTDICLSAVDPQPHPVNDVEIWCEYGWDTSVHPTLPLGNKVGPFRVDTLENSCFNYEQDSYHTLRCWTNDSLGNTNEMHWFDIVDSQAPVTNLEFEGPYYTNDEEICEGDWEWIWWKHKWKWVETCETVDGDVQWIDGVSTVNLTAVDPEPHPVGVDKTFYRNGIIENKYCMGEEWNGEYETLEQDWTEYSEPFHMNESCHAIEYYSVDTLGNTEVIKTEFVFVDKTAPENIKEVGEPSSQVNYTPVWNWYENPGQNIEWEVTLDTPVTISCGDVGPHPSGIEGMWYRIVWDGKYNDSSAEWTFANDEEVTIYFNEKSEHLLEFYCVDNVNKTSEIDSELFKVKGTSFDLEIGGKWDLVSVPFQLIGEGKVEEVFNDSNIIEVWSYEGGVWKVYSENVQTLTNIVPGRGYWIRSSDDAEVVIGGELYTDGGGVIPINGISLDDGWNLIGHYGTTEKTSYCSLFRLVDGDGPSWRNLLKYNPTPSVQNLIEMDLDENTVPGRGYWVDMTKEATYRPSSICFGESNYY
jgi:hypothetical protein